MKTGTTTETETETDTETVAETETETETETDNINRDWKCIRDWRQQQRQKSSIPKYHLH